MKKFILCASFVTLLGGGAEATEITNLTSLEWKCTVEVNGNELTIPSNDDRKIRLAVTCTTEEKGRKHTIKCQSRKNDIYIEGKDGSYSCSDKK